MIRFSTSLIWDFLLGDNLHFQTRWERVKKTALTLLQLVWGSHFVTLVVRYGHFDGARLGEKKRGSVKKSKTSHCQHKVGALRVSTAQLHFYLIGNFTHSHYNYWEQTKIYNKEFSLKIFELRSSCIMEFELLKTRMTHIIPYHTYNFIFIYNIWSYLFIYSSNVLNLIIYSQ